MISPGWNMKNRLYLSPPHLSGREQEFVGKAIASNWMISVTRSIGLSVYR